MRTIPVALIIAMTILPLFIAPVSAMYVLSSLTLAPDGPLVPGAQQEIIARYAVLPSGPTTFVPGHNLQMLTNLTDASWNIQVMVDGRNAARQTGSGKAVFVNGELLSYPATRDVSFEVIINGSVPGSAGAPVIVLHVVEIDNTGDIVPGSANTINEPVSEQNSTVEATATLTPPPVNVPAGLPSPTKSPAFNSIACIAALGTGLVLVSRRGA